ncbi:MAG: hypothetical protein JW791_03935 [Nanoarchaeota archaeon]|nr:hypothetical protein [Nanoarchaeota archaeon]
MILEIIGFVIGLVILIYLSPLVVNYGTKLGEILRVSPIIIGILAIAIGTSIPEISTSITSSILGHGDVNVGDAVGSSISQITLILGLSVLISGEVKVERKNLFILGSGVIISTIIAYSIIEKGYITRINGAILAVTYVALYYIISNSVTKKEYIVTEEKDFVFSQLWKKYSLYLGLSLIGLIIGSVILVNSVVFFSEQIGIPEYVVSFFAVGLGTSIPELFVGISAIKKKEYEIFVGDILGSNITDVTLSMGLGPIFRPNIIESNLIIPTGGYLVLVSIIVILFFGINKKIDRKSSLLLIGLYLLSFWIVK